MYASSLTSAILGNLSKAEIIEMYEKIIRIQAKKLETLRGEREKQGGDIKYEERVKEQERLVTSFEHKLSMLVPGMKYRDYVYN